MVISTLALNEEEDEEELEEDRQVLGSLKKSKNVMKLLQLFDPGNEPVERKAKPRRRRLTVDEDQLYRKKLLDKKEALLRRKSEERREAESQNLLLIKKEQLKKRKAAKLSKKESPVMRRESFAKLRAVPKRHDSQDKLGVRVEKTIFSESSTCNRRTSGERMEIDLPATEFPVQSPAPVILSTHQEKPLSVIQDTDQVEPAPVIMITEDDDPPVIIEPVQVQELSHSLTSEPGDSFACIDECSSDCFPSDDSPPPSPPRSPRCDQLDLMQAELDNLKHLLSGLKDRQTRNRKMVNSYRNRDYSFTGVYDRARRLRRDKEEALWNMMHGSPSPGLQLQPSNLVGTEKSFLDELHEAGDYCWEGISFGESTDL